MKDKSNFFLLRIIVVFILIPNAVFSQVHIKGKVSYQKDDMPAEHATIELSNKKEASLSDKSGNFSIYLSQVKNTDTLLISSVGYETLKIPVLSAIKKSEFKLIEKANNLAPVTVFNTRQVIGSNNESVGFYRGWSQKTGGEIGRIFHIPYKKFKIDKIRFKAGNLCDTCLLRVHIRNVVNGIPTEEILSDSISIFVNHLSLNTKIPEFDLTPYDLTFDKQVLFVGIEVLNCGNGKKGICSFSFAGTEKGEYLYKSKAASEWESPTNEGYTIHQKLFLRY